MDGARLGLPRGLRGDFRAGPSLRGHSGIAVEISTACQEDLCACDCTSCSSAATSRTTPANKAAVIFACSAKMGGAPLSHTANICSVCRHAFLRPARLQKQESRASPHRGITCWEGFLGGGTSAFRFIAAQAYAYCSFLGSKSDDELPTCALYTSVYVCVHMYIENVEYKDRNK